MDRRRSRTPLQSFTKPDVTPLVDLTFLLLIVFMITAPVLEYSLNISPPELNSDKIDSSEHQIINIDRKGIIHLAKIPVSRQWLEDELLRRFKKNKDLEIYIRADHVRPYGEVINLMKVIKGLGITNVSLVTTAEE